MMAPVEAVEEQTQTRSVRDHHGVLWVMLVLLAVVVTWLFGHLPWVVSGFSWPTTEAAPVGSSSAGLAGVRLTIPLVAAFLPSLVAFVLIGSSVAAVLPLAFPRLPRAAATAGAALVSLVTTLVVTLVARASIEDHAPDAFAGDERVLDGLLAVVLVGAVAAIAVGALSAYQPGFLPIPAAVVSGQLTQWLHDFLVDHPDADLGHTLQQLSHWLTFVLLAGAFWVSVRRSAWWMVLWPVAVLVVWTAVPFRVMCVQLAGQLRPSSGLPGALDEIIDAGVDVFRASFTEAPQTVWPWIAALVVGVLAVVARSARHKGSQAPPVA